jgi:transcriptional regulator with PAS, ATPase and Fis domain
MQQEKQVSARPIAVGRRRREQRRGLGSLCAALATALSRTNGEALRARLIECIRRVVPSAGGVAIRDWLVGETRLLPEETARLITFEIPTSDPRRIAILDALPGGGRALDDWDLQMLALASQIAALVLEIEGLRATSRVDAPRAQPPPPVAPPLVGSTLVMQRLRQTIERVAATDFTVLIEGESGTGKELVARQIHALSPRRAGPFVAVNCAALVETLVEAELFGIEERTATGVRGRRGKFEHANDGTLFLDEVSDLSPSAQAKLLRAVQDLAVERVGGNGSHRVDIRVIAATNRSLRQLVDEGRFRPDLFYRLSGVEVPVPPLRQREADVIELARHFLEQHRATRRLELTPEAADALILYRWPGNVRELQRVIEGIVCLGRSERVGLEDLPGTLRADYEAILLPSLARDETLRAWGSRYARLVWHRCDQNKRKAARALGISYHTLDAYLRYHPRPLVTQAKPAPAPPGATG